MIEKGIMTLLYFLFPVHDGREYSISPHSLKDSTKSSTNSLSSRCFKYELDRWGGKLSLEWYWYPKNQIAAARCDHTPTSRLPLGQSQQLFSNFSLVNWTYVSYVVALLWRDLNRIRLSWRSVLQICNGKVEQSLKSVADQCSSK